MAQDLFSTLRTYATKVSGGEKTPSEVSAALAAWAKESGEGIKEKVESEIESALLKMGFVRSGDLAKLEKRIADLENGQQRKSTKSTVKSTVKTVKKSVPAAKKSAKKSSVKSSKKAAPTRKAK